MWLTDVKIGVAYLVAITRFGFPPRVEDNIKAIRELAAIGFDGIELEAVAGENLDAMEALRDDLKRALVESGLEVPSFTAVVPGLYSLDAQLTRESLRTFERMVRLASFVGANVIDFCPYVPPELLGAEGSELYPGGPRTRLSLPEGFSFGAFWANAVDRTAWCTETAARYGLRTAVEGRVGDFVATTDGVLSLLAGSNPETSGLVLDLAHVHAVKEYFELVIPKLGQRILNVHVADNKGDHAYHLPLGEGNIDVDAVVHLLRAVGYQGYLCMDFGGVPRAWEESLAALPRMRALAG